MDRSEDKECPLPGGSTSPDCPESMFPPAILSGDYEMGDSIESRVEKENDVLKYNERRKQKSVDITMKSGITINGIDMMYLQKMMEDKARKTLAKNINGVQRRKK